MLFDNSMAILEDLSEKQRAQRILCKPFPDGYLVSSAFVPSESTMRNMIESISADMAGEGVMSIGSQTDLLPEV